MTLPEYQKQIAELIKELGFSDKKVPDVFLLMIEEIGEFAKAARKQQTIKTHAGSQVHDPSEEAADVFWCLLDLCNLLEIDLEKAFEAKVKKNRERQWS